MNTITFACLAIPAAIGVGFVSVKLSVPAAPPVPHAGPKGQLVCADIMLRQMRLDHSSVADNPHAYKACALLGELAHSQVYLQEYEAKIAKREAAAQEVRKHYGLEPLPILAPPARGPLLECVPTLAKIFQEAHPYPEGNQANEVGRLVKYAQFLCDNYTGWNTPEGQDGVRVVLNMSLGERRGWAIHGGEVVDVSCWPVLAGEIANGRTDTGDVPTGTIQRLCGKNQ
jgi:hypothetical protein